MSNVAMKLRGADYDRLYALPDAEPSRAACLSDAATIIRRVQDGKICVLVDDERANSGAILFVPAQMATPDIINFMASQGRGLICLALTGERVEALGLERLPHVGVARSNAAFTVSIEARAGVTTGISAFDRARTIAVAIDAAGTSDDLVTPGHVFPLVAALGGTLSHPGHAEAAVDLSRLAGLNSSGVFCALLNEHGDVARLSDLTAFVTKHDLSVGCISDLVRFRVQHDRDMVRVKSTSHVDDRGGRWEANLYRHAKTGVEALALVSSAPRPARMPLYIDYRPSCTGLLVSPQRADAERPLATPFLRSGSIAILLDRELSNEAALFGLTAPAGKDCPTLDRAQHLMCAQILADLDVADFELVEGSAVGVADLAKYRSWTSSGAEGGRQ